MCQLLPLHRRPQSPPLLKFKLDIDITEMADAEPEVVGIHVAIIDKLAIDSFFKGLLPKLLSSYNCTPTIEDSQYLSKVLRQPAEPASRTLSPQYLYNVFSTTSLATLYLIHHAESEEVRIDFAVNSLVNLLQSKNILVDTATVAMYKDITQSFAAFRGERTFVMTAPPSTHTS